MKTLPVAALLLALAPTAAAQDVAGGGAFLLLPVGARSTALGQTGAALRGIEAAFWNPAGLTGLDRSTLAVHYGSTFASDNSAISLALVSPGVGVLALSAYLVDLGSQEIVPAPGVVVGRLSPKNIELLASLATRLVGRLSFGINYKLIQFRQDCSGSCVAPGGTILESVVGTTHGVDVGAQYPGILGQDLNLGLVIRHAGFDLQLENRDQADPLPTRVQLGAAYTRVLPHPPDQAGFDVSLIAEMESDWNDYGDPTFRLGAELGYADAFDVRAGYAFLNSETSGPSLGVGFRFGNLAVDVARVFFLTTDFEEPLFVALRLGL